MLAFKVLISTVIYFHLTWNIVCVYIFVYPLLFFMSNRTMATVWHRKSVKELESYLKERCVSVSNSRKATLVQLWEGIGDVGSARYKPAPLLPCPTIRVLFYSNW